MIKDIVLITVIILLGLLLLYVYVYKLKKHDQGLTAVGRGEELDDLLLFVKNKFNDMLKVNLYEMNLSKEAFEKRLHNKNQLRKSLKNCTYGDLNAKNYIKQYIRDLLLNHYPITEDSIDGFISFRRPGKLSIADKFQIILYVYQKEHGLMALTRLIEDYELDKPKKEVSGIAYIISKDEIQEVFESLSPIRLSFHDKVAILSQKVYQHYKGYGVIDDIRDMQVDGVSGGVSGIPPDFANLSGGEIELIDERPPFNYDSIWLFFKGKTIHLDFLSFGSERELIRVCKNIYRFNKPGQLSESNGYKINEMKDGSRVVVARPPFCESWVFFVRKFDSVKRADLSELITDEGHELVCELMLWLIKGCQVTALTGAQGTGKTTLLMALIKHINPAFTLRIQETAFELNLRKTYPRKNIVTFRETSTVSGQEGLDLQKKTDGTVNILGEVASAPIAALMIQMTQVASLFTLFTHHAKTSKHLVSSLRNNLLQTGVFSNEKIAEQQVADVINFDIHLGKDIDGHRYIERITEIIPLDNTKPYLADYKHANNHEDRIEGFMDTMTDFFERMTDRQMYETRDVMRYESGKYEWCDGLSTEVIASIEKHLLEEEVVQFRRFIEGDMTWIEASS